MPLVVKAAVAFGPNEPLQIREVTLADPGPGEVLVKLRATGLCHSDLSALEGKIAQTFPVILGHEGIGDVVAVGDGVTDFAPGDRVMPYLVPDCGECAFCKSGRTNLCVQMMVRRQSAKTPFSLDGQPIASYCGLGTFAEMTVVPVDSLVKVNPGARTDHACCIACGVTTGLGAALITAKVTPGSSVAVFGTGGVGLSVIQGAKIAGATRIIAIDTNPAKAAIALKLGATDFINPKDVENIVVEVQKLTGMGVDFAFDCVGHPGLARQALESTNPAWGLSVCVGVIPAGQELSAAPFNLMTGRKWTGSLMGGAKRVDVARYVDMYVDGTYGLDDLVSHHLTLDEVNKGFEMMRSGEAVRSVVVYVAD
ncbi:S-(hydroxymethyl)glutathione dehydrogenase [Pseudomonas sp. 9AZ]|uniref:alcohol dehydrogenase catalytic domain-containing protein n=1 Tax=Pseudomonas sp. 9AZ TaxID=2653168 RepID=UPI0012EFF2F4|nr:zinc-binding dehydrogenase [Pseudomonas sp. 9AZ]VXD05191.1 S-(hydroxymethyl)glutathione dehydrogenase [Pseudomonas sp. 9AZ]